VNHYVTIGAMDPTELANLAAELERLLRLRALPFAQYGIQQDVRAGMAVSYPGRN